MRTRTLRVHLRRVPPGTAPGQLYVRLCTLAQPQRLLDAHPVDPAAVGPSGLSEADQQVVFRWLDEHPGDAVRVYLYDGGTGDCFATVLAQGGEDARARAGR